jgi:hypothetical protein
VSAVRPPCSVCGRAFAITRLGRTRWHYAHKSEHAIPANVAYCKGSGEHPTGDVLPSPGDVIDAWPPGVPLRERAPVRGWTVLAITEKHIVLDEAAIPRRSAWRMHR